MFVKEIPDRKKQQLVNVLLNCFEKFAFSGRAKNCTENEVFD